jgi:hypothetical protein
MGMIKYHTGQGDIVHCPVNGQVDSDFSTLDGGASGVDTVVSLWQNAHPGNATTTMAESMSDEIGEESTGTNLDNLLPAVVASKLQTYKAGHICDVSGRFPLLDTLPGVYSIDVARQLGAVAGWSYSDVDTFKDILSDDTKTCFTNADFMEISVRNDAMFIVATAQIIRTRDRRVAVVCFRGTEVTNLINWATDATTRKVAWNGLSGVHGGFVRNLEAVWYGPKGILAHLLAPCMVRQGYDYDDQEHFALISDPTRNEQDVLEAIFITGHRYVTRSWHGLLTRKILN